MNHRFSDAALLELALTHTSWANEHGGAHNERLEFLGDSVLQLCATELLYARFPEEREGNLHRYRAQLVQTSHLAGLARKWGLDKQIRLGRGEENSGGRDKNRQLAGVFEAVLGAIFLDGGFHAAEEEIHAVLLPDLEGLSGVHDARQVLDKWCQANHGAPAEFEVVQEEGPPHDRTFHVVVRVDGEPAGEGSGRSKRLASLAAAHAAVNTLGVQS